MQPQEELRYLVLALQREGTRQLAEALRPLGLTPAQAEVLQVLAQYQPMTLLQLGERLICESGSPSRLIKSMVEAGWVEKISDPLDGRAVQLRLSAQAEALMPTLNAVENAYNQQVTAALSEAQIRTLLEIAWPLVDATAGGRALQLRKDGA